MRKAKQARSKADSGPPSKRPIARPPESDEDEEERPSSGTRVLPSSRPVRPEPTGKASSKSDAGMDAPTVPKPPKAKRKAAAAPDDVKDTLPTASSSQIPEPPAKVQSTSKRKLPAPPKSFVESELDSDDEPPPPRAKAVKPKGNAQPTSKNPGDVASAKEEGVSAPSAHAERPGGSSKRRRDEQAVAVPPVELESEPLDDLGAPAEDEESGAPKPKKGSKAPRERAAKSTKETQDDSAGTSRKRGRGKQVAQPAENHDEQPQEPDEPPAPPRKRTKRAAASDLEIPADVPDPVEGDAEEPDDTPEEPAPKPRSKPTSRPKKAPASREKTQAARCVYRSRRNMLGCSCHSVSYYPGNRER